VGRVARRRGVGYGLGAAVYHLTPLPGGVAFFWLVVAGGFGGIINGIVNDGGQGKIRFPRWHGASEKDADADLGFFGEMLVQRGKAGQVR